MQSKIQEKFYNFFPFSTIPIISQEGGFFYEKNFYIFAFRFTLPLIFTTNIGILGDNF